MLESAAPPAPVAPPPFVRFWCLAFGNSAFMMRAWRLAGRCTTSPAMRSTSAGSAGAVLR
jgi:hypothetical protein